jgi:hypothetical protein
MTTLQEQYVTLVRQGQEATLGVVDAWTKSFQDAAVNLPHTAQTASREAVNQVFDLAVGLIDIQSNFTKQLTSAAASVVEDAAGRVSRAATEAGTIADKAERASKKAA